MNLAISRNALVFIFLFTLQWSHSQERKDYELLWEIQHKDSDKKSYLFGTMHLKDERVFQFSDAVIPALKRAESFAMEIHPDSIGTSFGAHFFKQKEDNIYKRVLSEEQYEQLNRRYKEKTGRSLDSSSFRSPMYIKSVLREDTVKETDKRTFLDGWLYGMAYNLDKPIFGLEKVEDQLPIIDGVSDEEIRDNILYVLESDPSKYQKSLEHMIQMYYDGDIQKLYTISVGLFAIDEVLNKRNHVMANSLDVIIKEGTSIFAAIGAAHLAGDEGLISLMKQKGYKVNLVPSTFEKSMNDYPIEPNTDKWHLQENLELGYRISTPSIPGPFKMKESIDLNIAADLIFGGAFGFMAIDLRGKGIGDDVDVVQRIINEQTNNDPERIINESNVTIAGIPGKDILFLDKQDSETRMQLTYHNQILYSFFVQHDLEELNSPYINAFFNSIQLFDPQFTKSEWTRETDSIGAYTVHVPGEKTDISREVPNPYDADSDPYEMNIYMWQDRANTMLYLLRYNDQPLGYHAEDENIQMIEFKEQLSQYATLVGEPEPYLMDGVRGYQVELMIQDKYHAYARLIFRGNRTYVLMAQNNDTEEKSTTDNYFFNSFKLTPIQYHEFSNLYKVGDRYTIKLSEKTGITTDSSYYDNSGYATDIGHFGVQKGSGGVYSLNQTYIKPYFRLENLEKELKGFSESFIEKEGDTITRYIDTFVDGIPAKEILVENPNSGIKTFAQLFLDGDSFIQLQFIGSEEELNSNFCASFFKSFKREKKDNSFDIMASKSKAMFKALKSKDSITRRTAEDAFDYLIFVEEDEKLLFKSLSGTYFDKETSIRIQGKIIKELCLIGDKETLQKLKSFYVNKKTSNSHKIALLENLYHLKTPETATAYFDLLKNHQPKRPKDRSFEIFNSLLDSVPLFLENQKIVGELLEVDDYRDHIVNFYRDHIVDDSLKLSKSDVFRPYILKHLKKDVQRFVDTTERRTHHYLHFTGLINNYLHIIDQLEDSSEITKEGLRTLYSEMQDNNWNKTTALLLSIKKGYNISEKIIDAAQEDLYTRWEVMEALVQQSQREKINPLFLQQDEFAKLSVYNTAGYGTIYPDIMEKLGEFTHNDLKFAAYSYGYTSDKENTRYHGVCLLETPNLDDFKLLSCYTNDETLQEDWETQGKALVDYYNQ